MTSSIRTFLLINLLLSATLITSLAIVGNLFLAHDDIQKHLNIVLSQTTTNISTLFRTKPSAQVLQKMQYNIDHPNTENIKLWDKTLNNKAKPSDSTTEFQVWDKEGNLILHSKNAPSEPLSNGKTGLSRLWLDNHTWLVSTLTDPSTTISIMAADKVIFRQHLENTLTQDSIFIMLITYPFLGLLIWFIVGRGLKPLEKVAEEVKHRAPSRLDPVALDHVPNEVKPLINELNSLFTRLQTAFIRHERFTADAAHELKTPLAALSTQTQVALRADTPAERNEVLLKVLGGVNRCTHVVQQLLTLSRTVPEAGINDPTDVNLSKQATEILAMLAPEAIAKDIDLELFSPDKPAYMQGNTTSLGILIRNLVDNAIRYSDENTCIQVHIINMPSHIILRVVDNGPGIPQELRDRVFERFFRVVGNRTTGSGLGLGIVQQIVNLHEASIELLTAESGRGLEVKITFPKKLHNQY